MQKLISLIDDDTIQRANKLEKHYGNQKFIEMLRFKLNSRCAGDSDEEKMMYLAAQIIKEMYEYLYEF